MQWQYRTMLFEFTKDGLLGDKYVDEEEMEKTLNQWGGRGWELINVLLLQDGVLAFLKKGAQREQVAEEPETVVAPPPQPPIKPRTTVEAPPKFVIPGSAIEPEPVPIPVAERQRPAPTRNDDTDFIGGIRIS